MAEKKKRGITFPHMFTLILLIIAVCTILTYIVWMKTAWRSLWTAATTASNRPP